MDVRCRPQPVPASAERHPAPGGNGARAARWHRLSLFVEDYQKRVVKKLFGRYVSKDVYEQLLANPDGAELGGKRRDMSVLFSDIRGFTTVTEKGDAEALVAQLNEYFSRMVEIVFRHTGTVDKFVGDMVMALYGAPLDDPHHAEHAVATAIEMVHELGQLNRMWAARGMPQLDIPWESIPGHDRRQHRVVGDHELHGHRRQRQPRIAAGVVEQAVRQPHNHQ
jgi:hypothetical protein